MRDDEAEPVQAENPYGDDSAGSAGPEDSAASAGSGGLSRRGFLGATGAVGSAVAATTVLAAGPASAAPAATLAQERAMLLRIAALGAVFPLRVPLRGESGPSAARHSLAALRAVQRRHPGKVVALGDRHTATMSTLVSAERRLTAPRLAEARAAADALIARGHLTTGQPALVTAIAERAGTTDRAGLLAAIALAVAAAYPGSASMYTATATQWLDLVAALHHRGTLQGATRHQGLR